MITPEVRAEVLQRAGGRCEECSQIVNAAGPAGLHLHHTEYRVMDTPDNLRVLCPRCHRTAHLRPRRALVILNVRLTEKDAARLAAVAERMELTRADVARMAIRELAKREGVE